MFGTIQWLMDSMRNSFGIVTELCKAPFKIKTMNLIEGDHFPKTQNYTLNYVLFLHKKVTSKRPLVNTENNGGSTKTQVWPQEASTVSVSPSRVSTWRMVPETAGGTDRKCALFCFLYFMHEKCASVKRCIFLDSVQ